jgi:hypothetical protein
MENFQMSSDRDSGDKSSGNDSGVNKRKASLPWLVHPSSSGVVPTQYEPDITSILMAEKDIDLFRIGHAIGHRQLTDAELEKVPKYLTVGRNSKGDVPAILGMNLGPFWVDEQVHNLLEKLEPGAQKFLPIAVKAKDGKPIRGQATLSYFILILPPVLECMDYDRTIAGGKRGPAAHAGYMRLSSGKDDIITLRSSVIAGHHFWRAPKENGYEYFGSEELRLGLKEQGLRGWDFVKQCQVS